jgi:large subunit ribosomal protein L3
MSTKKVYTEGLIGKKLGMSQVFTAEGECVPVTVIEVGPCYILEVKDDKKNGYQAVQLGYGAKKPQRVNKAAAGHFAKAGKGSFYHVKEMRCDTEALGWNEAGQELKVGDVFSDGELVSISGITKGRGFAGVVKKFRVKGQPSTRGTHEVRRHIGAIGQRKFPGRVFKNQKMPGHLGAELRTTRNIEVVAVKPEDNVMLVKGGIPGHRGGIVVIKKAKKNYKLVKAA